MIRLLIVGGDSHERLASFMESRGTFEIVDSFNNLADNLTLIQAKIIDVDKLLYLYHVDETDGTADINIRADMQALRDLLGTAGSRTFFKVGEIDFVTGTGKHSNAAVRYFKTVMQECSGTAYHVMSVEGHMTFGAVYDAVMGVSVNKDFTNKWLTNYKVERNAEADLEYELQNDTDMIIEPFRYDGICDYFSRQKTSVRIDSGNVYKVNGDTEQETVIDPDFGRIDTSNFLRERKVVLISGRAKSGKSVWAAQLAASSQKCGITGCMLDFTHNSDIGKLLESSDVPVSNCRMLELLQLPESTAGTLSYCHICNNDEYSVRFEFAQNFFSRQLEQYEAVLVALEHEDLERMFNLLENKVDDVLITCSAVVDDVTFHQEELLMFSRSARVSLILNEHVVMMNGHRYASIDEIKSINDEKIRLIKSITFSGMNARPGIFKSLIAM